MGITRQHPLDLTSTGDDVDEGFYKVDQDLDDLFTELDSHETDSDIHLDSTDRAKIDSLGLSNWKGAYSSSTTYALGDSVAYDNHNWLSLTDGNLGNTPSRTSTYWSLVSGALVTGLTKTTPTAGSTLSLDGFSEFTQHIDSSVYSILKLPSTGTVGSGLKFALYVSGAKPLKVVDSGDNELFYINKALTDPIFCWLLDDGTWKFSDSSVLDAAGYADLYQFNTDTLTSGDKAIVCKAISTTQACVIYSTSGALKILLIEQDNGVITVKDTETVTSAGTSRFDLAKVSATQVLVVYRGTSDYIYGRLVNISGDNLSVKSEYTLLSKATNTLGCDCFTSSLALVGTYNSTDSKSQMFTVTISGDILSANTPVDLSVSTYEVYSQRVSDTTMIMGRGTQYDLISVSGSTPSTSSSVSIIGYTCWDICVLNTEYAVALAPNTSGSYPYLHLLKINGSTLSNEDSLNLHTSGLRGSHAVSKISETEILCSGYSGTDPFYHALQKVSRSGDTLSLDGDIVLFGDDSNYPRSMDTLDTGVHLGVYYDTEGYGQIFYSEE